MIVRNFITLRISIIFLCTTVLQFITVSAFSLELKQDKNQIEFVDGVSARLIDSKKEDASRFIQIGVYQDFLYKNTKQNFTQNSPGILVSFQHQLWDFWRGGLEARWSHWTQKDGDFKYFMPLGLYSKIALQPNFSVGNFIISPYLNFGLGYTLFLNGNAYFKFNIPVNFGEFSAIGGGGISLTFAKSFGLNVSFDAWKGLETEQYFVGMLSFALVKPF